MGLSATPRGRAQVVEVRVLVGAAAGRGGGASCRSGEDNAGASEHCGHGLHVGRLCAWFDPGLMGRILEWR